MSRSFSQEYSMKDIAFRRKSVLSWAEDNNLKDDCNHFSMNFPVFSSPIEYLQLPEIFTSQLPERIVSDHQQLP